MKRLMKLFIRPKQNISLQKFFFSTYVKLILLVALIGCIFATVYLIITTQSEYDSSMHTIHENTIEYYLRIDNDIRMLVERTAANQQLISLMREYKTQGASATDTAAAIVRVLNSVKALYSGRPRIALFFDRYRMPVGERAILPQSIEQTQLYQRCQGRQVLRLNEIADDELLLYFKGQTYISQLRDETGEVLGLLALSFQEEWMESIFSNHQVLLIDEHSSWCNVEGLKGFEARIYSKLTNAYGKISFNIKTKRFNGYYTKLSEGRYLVTINDNTMIDLELSTMVLYVGLLMACLIGFALFISKHVSHMLIRPINQLIAFIQSKGLTYKAHIADATFDRRRSLRKKIKRWYVLIPLISIMLLCIVLSSLITKVIRNNRIEILKMTLINQAQSISTFLKMCDNITMNIGYSTEVLDFFNDPTDHNRNPYRLKAAVDQNIAIIGTSFDVDLYNEAYAKVFSTRLSLANDNLKVYDTQLKERHGRIVWNYSDVDFTSQPCISCIRMIMDINASENKYSYNKILGYLKMTTPENTINKLYSNFEKGDLRFYLLDEQGRIISCTAKQYLGMLSGLAFSGKTNHVIEKDVNDELIGSQYMYKEISNYPLYLITTYPDTVFFGNWLRTLLPSLLLATGIFLFVHTIAGNLSYYIVYQFSLVQSGIYTSAGEHPQLDDISISEVRLIFDTFQTMTKEINNLIQEVFINELQKKEEMVQKRNVELALLQAQMNPHFLCNTLETVNSLVDANQLNDASRLIKELVVLFSSWVDGWNMPISIQEEIRYTKAYLAIQMVRYGDKLHDQWEVEESALNCLTLRFLLQPLIENAIYHGLRVKEGGGYIHVCVRTDQNNVIMCVSDNGVGMTKEKTASIEASFQDKKKTSHIGLYNVQKRIQLYYGNEYHLRIESDVNVGTKIYITIPRIINVSEES